LGVDVREIRLPQQLEGVAGLIIPGGESTTISKLIDIYDLRAAIIRHASEGMGVWGTCAGMILLAKHLTENSVRPLGLMNMTVARNAFGRQVDSFEADLQVRGLTGGPYTAVFIRAPVIHEVGEGVDDLAALPDGRAVAVRQGKLLATAFHPELTSDPRMHRYFIDMVKEPD
jgi:5'-phosphate synthase pdxT subunit